MRVTRYFVRFGALVAAVAMLLGSSRAADAQSQQSVSIGAGYTFLRTNVLPGCNCVGLQGGFAEMQYRFAPHFAALADITVAHRSGITPDGYSLTQTAYTFGVRFWPTKPRTRLRPFGDLSLGGAHASGSLSPGSVFGASSNAFALQTGGGMQLRLGRRFTLQPLEADYLLTTFSNGSANRQNDLRLSSGLLFRLGR